MRGDAQEQLEHEPKKVRSNTKIPSRFRRGGDYCGATWHASFRNQGRTPKKRWGRISKSV